MDRIPFPASTPEGARALAAVSKHIADSGLDATLVNLVYLRVSQINGCAYCIDAHSRDLAKTGVPLAKIMLTAGWREGGALFDPRERAALAWAESLTRIVETGAPDGDYAAAAEMFEERELADLTVAIALMNAYNRIGVGLRLPPPSAHAARR